MARPAPTANACWRGPSKGCPAPAVRAWRLHACHGRAPHPMQSSERPVPYSLESPFPTEGLCPDGATICRLYTIVNRCQVAGPGVHAAPEEHAGRHGRRGPPAAGNPAKRRAAGSRHRLPGYPERRIRSAPGQDGHAYQWTKRINSWHVNAFCVLRHAGVESSQNHQVCPCSRHCLISLTVSFAVTQMNECCS